MGGRVLVRYYLRSYIPSGGTADPSRFRIIRDFRLCSDANCLNTTPIYGAGDQITILGENLNNTSGNMQVGEPILDWVSSFKVNGKNRKISGTYINQFQTLEINIVIGNKNRVVQGTKKSVVKDFTFLTRAKNVSLIP